MRRMVKLYACEGKSEVNEQNRAYHLTLDMGGLQASKVSDDIVTGHKSGSQTE